MLRDRDESDGGVRRAPEGGYGPPAREELRTMPWSGEGPDPLEELFELEGDG